MSAGRRLEDEMCLDAACPTRFSCNRNEASGRAVFPAQQFFTFQARAEGAERCSHFTPRRPLDIFGVL